jgi:predicted RecB family nuclease
VNYELPIRGKVKGRIDFLVKRDPKDPWRVVEVKLDDNPTAVTQLDDYIKSIKHEVRELKKQIIWIPISGHYGKGKATKR